MSAYLTYKIVKGCIIVAVAGAIAFWRGLTGRDGDH
jgi:hypothetical protein